MITKEEARVACEKTIGVGWYVGCPFQFFVDELCQDRIMGPTRANIRLSIKKLRDMWDWTFSGFMREIQ